MRRRRQRERKTCKYDNHKVIFAREIDAKIALARRRDNHDKEKVPNRAYECTLAPPGIRKHWHLTSEKERNVADE